MKVSAHLLIDRKGEMVQFVPFHKRAWHAGRSVFNGRENCNDFSIGIELEGADNVDYETAQYEALGAGHKRTATALAAAGRGEYPGALPYRARAQDRPGPGV